MLQSSVLRNASIILFREQLFMATFISIQTKVTDENFLFLTQLCFICQLSSANDTLQKFDLLPVKFLSSKKIPWLKLCI